MKKRQRASQKIAIMLLLVATIFAGYKAFDSNSPKESTTVVNKEGKVYSTSSIFSSFNSTYDYYLNEALSGIGQNVNVFDKTNTNTNNLYYKDTYGNSNNYYGDKNQSLINKFGASTVYNDTKLPSIRVQSPFLQVGEYFDPMEYVSANHAKFGDVSHLIEVTYNDVNVNRVGQYTVVYKACNYYGSSYCRTADMLVRVVDSKNNVSSTNNNKYYTKTPVWSNDSSMSCTYGNSKCSMENITKPYATDPYSGKSLYVKLISGSVDPYQPGTYTLVYSATTEHGYTSTTTRTITVKQPTSNTVVNNNVNNNFSNKKYISNYHKSYYDDGVYAGYLTANASSAQVDKKYINNYEWTNQVTYSYQCTNPGYYGTDGWSYVSTLTADDHPTQYYNKDGYQGTLTKTGFYCIQGCTEKLIPELGLCSYYGQTKTITRTWVGMYAGYVTSTQNTNTTYSGYVYLK